MKPVLLAQLQLFLAHKVTPVFKEFKESKVKPELLVQMALALQMPVSV